MCRALRFGKAWKKRGELIPVRNTRTNAKVKATWVREAKREHIDWWRQQGKFDLVSIKPDAFRKIGFDFKLSKDARIFGILLGQDVEIDGRIIGREGEMFLLTRDARTETEKKTHDRWPVVFTKDEDRVRLFEGEDISGANDDEQTAPGT